MIRHPAHFVWLRSILNTCKANFSHSWCSRNRKISQRFGKGQPQPISWTRGACTPWLETVSINFSCSCGSHTRVHRWDVAGKAGAYLASKKWWILFFVLLAVRIFLLTDHDLSPSWLNCSACWSWYWSLVVLHVWSWCFVGERSCRPFTTTYSVSETDSVISLSFAFKLPACSVYQQSPSSSCWVSKK